MSGQVDGLDKPYLEYVDLGLVPEQESILVQTHVPKPFRATYHHHASVEVNFLIGCSLEYSFSGRPVQVESEQMTVFWGVTPHRVSRVFGKGRIVVSG